MQIKQHFPYPLLALALLAALAPRPAVAVSMTTTTVNGLLCDVWTWTDAAGLARTAALKEEGHGNAGHGGYVIQFTYVAGGKTITVNAESGGDGGFGYFVSHERLWPYQPVQYSLPCNAGQFNTPTSGKKIAWGSVAYFGTSLTSVYNGKKSFAFNGFPKSNNIQYSVCLVLGQFPAGKSLTALAAATYAKVTPASSCATAK